MTDVVTFGLTTVATGETEWAWFVKPEGFSLEQRDWFVRICKRPNVQIFGGFKTKAEAEEHQRDVLRADFLDAWNPTQEKPQ
jgi:hypothetical protein